MIKRTVVLLSLLLLAACSGNRSEYSSGALSAAPLKATSRPYKINGKWYYPQHHYEYDEMGLASWYGPRFHGKPTSTGEIFDMYKMTAAHKTLPLPCIVIVTNLENGRMLKMKVNDRGPFVDGRIIDLSKKGAELLGVHLKGTAKVRVQTIVDESIALASTTEMSRPATVAFESMPAGKIATESLMPASKKPAPYGMKPFQSSFSGAKKGQNKQFDLFNGKMSGVKEFPPETQQGQAQPYRQLYVQVGTFSQQGNANGLLAKLQKYGKPSVRYGYIGKQSYYRVRMGPFNTSDNADHLLKKLIKAGFKDARIVVD